MANSNPRPLSPHLTIWRWGPHMLVSILHRMTGAGLTIFGLALLCWWLSAIAGGSDALARFTAFVEWTKFGLPWVKLMLIGLTWAFFQHVFSGVRHLVMDAGAGFELQTNKMFAILTIFGALVVTALVWAKFLGVLA
jgi:succinate dehydrogenase / fumarate reductase cytochrome b subunit